MIIDEEHRFGVRHKERLKAMRAEVDVLTLTATPIPRTLGMALEGLRDLSVIATAPQRRLAIKTFVRNEGNGVDPRGRAARTQARRPGVLPAQRSRDDREPARDAATQLLPEARIAVAHGQMPERELERVMRDFVAQRFNVLLCSTIIETGIDVPTANTIVISRADKFGLAQLHQLRGRVGRSHHQAYAYLMVPDVERPDQAGASSGSRRSSRWKSWAAGFYLAMHDLEIRGAGEVLGENQSGNMQEVGFQLYNEMLTEAVRSLKAGPRARPARAAVVDDRDQPARAGAAARPTTAATCTCACRSTSGWPLPRRGRADRRLLEEIIDRFGKLPDAGGR